MWTRVARFWPFYVALCSVWGLYACSSDKQMATQQLQACFPVLKADTVHLASWCGKEDEPEFKDHLCQDRSMAKSLHLDAGSFRCFGQMPLDKGHTLYIVETYTGMCGTTFLPYMGQRGVDTLTYLAVPFANALYGDGEMQTEGDDLLAEEADEVWLVNEALNGGLKYIYSDWHEGCTAVASKTQPGQLERKCKVTYQPPAIYAWGGDQFIQIFLAHPDWYWAHRYRKIED
jgi:hypothetical protein